MVANLSVISCIPTCRNTFGSLMLSLQPSASSQFISFTPGTPTTIHPVFYEPFERIVHDYTFFDPSNTFSADAFGFSVYNHAKNQNSSFPIQPDLLKSSAEDVFTTFYAGLVNTQLMEQAASPRIAQGTLSLPITRLYVVTFIAYIIVGFLGVILVCNILLFIYTETKHSILHEEPIGLMGNAALLRGSDVSAFVSEFRERHGNGIDMRKFVKKKYTMKESMCWFDDQEGCIRIEGLMEK
jgi:hypothetical protein